MIHYGGGSFAGRPPHPLKPMPKQRTIRPWTVEADAQVLQDGPYVTTEPSVGNDVVHVSKVTKRGQVIEGNRPAPHDIVAAGLVLRGYDIVCAVIPHNVQPKPHADGIDIDGGEGPPTPTILIGCRVRRVGDISAIGNWGDPIIIKRSHSAVRFEGCSWDGSAKVTAQAAKAEKVRRVEVVNCTGTDRRRVVLFDGVDRDQVFADDASMGLVDVFDDRGGRITPKKLESAPAVEIERLQRQLLGLQSELAAERAERIRLTQSLETAAKSLAEARAGMVEASMQWRAWAEQIQQLMQNRPEKP